MSAVEASRRCTDLLEALAAYCPENAGEQAVLARFLAFLDRPDPFLHGDPEGHVTASAIVVQPPGDAILLVSHRKLGGWLQPGGHVDPDDVSVFAAAVREVREETGLDRLESTLGDAVLDLDVHAIPAFGSEPAHVHYDVRFLLTSEDGAALSDGAAWFALEAIPRVDRDGSLDRAVRKAIARLPAR
jgi:8-oxo-dGTP pyrophosphatase MutT (NUDIX family)